MDYLKENNLCKALLTLEEEAGINLFRYGKEINFLRQLILDGCWDDVENFLELSQIREKIDFNQLMFFIGRQKYLELLENQALDQNFILAALKSLEPLCSKEDYNGLCYLLTLKTLTDHPDYANWTVQRGRIECFESIKGILNPLFGGQSEKRRTTPNRLLKLLRDSVNYQYYIAKQTGSMTTLKFDPVSQCSEVSLLKDLTNQDSQNKFNKQYLNEVKIGFYNRSQPALGPNQQQNPRFNSLCQSIEVEEKDIPIEIDDDEDEEAHNDDEDYFDKDFAQSMPANFTLHSSTAGTQQQQKQNYNQVLSQSINHNVFAGRQQQPQARQNFLNEEHQKFIQGKQGNTVGNVQLNQNIQQFNMTKGKQNTLQQQQQQQQLPSGSSPEYQMSAMQQQMANDKQYKSIQYHKQRQSYDKQSYDKNEDVIMNNSTSLNNSKVLQSAQLPMRQKNQPQPQPQATAYSTNFEFQRPTAQFNQQQNDLVNKSAMATLGAGGQDYNSNQQFKYTYHQRTGSKGGGAAAGQQQQQNVMGASAISMGSQQQQNSSSEHSQQSLNQKRQGSGAGMNQSMAKGGIVEAYPLSSSEQNLQRKPVQNNNFIFQNDSDHEDASTGIIGHQNQQHPQNQNQMEEVKSSYQMLGASKNQKTSPYQQPFSTSQYSQQQQLLPSQLQQQQMNDDQAYEDDFIEHNGEEEDEHQSEKLSQQQSVRQIVSQPTAEKQQQQQQQQNNNYLDTEGENPQQLISDIDPSIDNNICNLALKAILVDSQPIRTACFSPQGNYLALGTNSKALKICALPNLNSDDEDDDDEELRDYSANEKEAAQTQKLQVLFENENHHNGSLYCIDWSRTQRLIASGSNDRSIKILVCPDLENNDNQNQLLVLLLLGHSAIVRTVCFNPADDLILLSGGLNDNDLKIWNSETGKNFANLKGHNGSIYSIKMSNDGSYAMSVGTDKFIRIWDIRTKSSVCSIDGSLYTDMNEIVFSQSPSIDSSSINTLQSQLSGLACVAHVDGSITFWDMNMRKCLGQQFVHSSEARGVSFTVDGKYLASAGFDSQISITDTSDLDNLTIVKTLQHDDKVVSVKWHPFLPLLLSTSADKTARVWYPQMTQ